MDITSARKVIPRIFFQRCFWLFVALLILIGASLFVPTGYLGRQLMNSISLLLLIATVAAVGRGKLSFLFAMTLAAPAMWFHFRGLWHDSDSILAWSWLFSASLYFIAIISLIRYVFQPRIMTQDKLFGAAAVFLMIGVLWAYLYSIIGFFDPQSFLINGHPGQLNFPNALYLSITVLTSTGFGDVVPFTRQARGICMIEQIAGVLFVAILIARLAGVYSPRESSNINGEE